MFIATIIVVISTIAVIVIGVMIAMTISNYLFGE